MGDKLKVNVFPYRKGIGYGNIYWEGKFPMRGGFFPSKHPAAPGKAHGAQITAEYGQGPLMDAFRNKGYMASCFPEGDGIAWAPKKDQSDSQCLTDIREAFGWEAEWNQNVVLEPQ